MQRISYKRHRFPPEVIQHAVWLYFRFTLSSGQAAYAIMSFGGFLGMGELAHPIPWAMLDYDEERDGYVVDLTREQLEKAPAFRLDESDRPRERRQEELVYSYYGQLPWWGGPPPIV